MALKSSDMPESTKRALLDALRDKLGHSNYDQAVQLMGEDGLLDAVLRSASGGGSASGVAGSSKASGTGAWEGILWFLVLAWSCGGPLGVALLVGFLLIVWLVAYVADNWSAPTAKVFACVIAVAGLGVGGWKGGPWLWQGTQQWWHWLGGHF